MMESWMNGREVVVPAKLSWDEANQRMSYYIAVRAQLPRVIGQLCCYLEDKWSEKSWQIIGRLHDEARLEYTTIRQYMSLWRRFGHDWNLQVPISVYQAVEGQPKLKADELISAYLGGKYTRTEIRKMAQNGRNGHGGRVDPTLNGTMAQDGEILPTAKGLAIESFGQAMAVCATLIRHDDDDNLIEAIDDLIAKGTVLRAMLESSRDRLDT